MTPHWKIRYQAAHDAWFKEHYPAVTKDGHTPPKQSPQVSKANGLTTAIVNYMKWVGADASRIATEGRYIEGKQHKTASGAIIQDKGFRIQSSVKKGTADVVGTIQGRSVNIEVKVGADKPRPAQLSRQISVRRAGGIYEFVSTIEQFFELYDKIMSLPKIDNRF